MQKNHSKSTLVYNTNFKIDYIKPKYWGTWLGVFFVFLVNLLPALIVDGLSNKLGDLARNINAKRRRIARKNIDLCFPDLSEQEKKAMLRENFRHQIRSILHYGLIWWAPKTLLKKRIVFNGQEHIEASLNNNRSVIFMAAHSLGLEAAVAAATINYPSSGPFNPIKNKLIDWLIAKGRSRHGGILYTRDAGLRPIIKDVRAGCTMFYLPDEDLGKDRSIFVPFFGVEKACVPVLGRLAKSCKADVLPCMACYDEYQHRYVINILPPLQNFPQGDDYQDTLTMNLALEELIRLCPGQYFWVMKLFKTLPDGSKRKY